MNKQIILTVAGKEKLEKELEFLRNTKRVEIKEALKHARSQGDLSENADYDAAKDDQSINESRIQEIEYTLKVAEIIESTDDETIFDVNKTAKVKFYDIDEVDEVTLVSSVEADTANMKISIDSPLGKALFKLPIGKRISVHSPDGNYDIEVLEII